MDELFNPRNIAVIGASRYREKVGHDIFRNILRGSKRVYPVNPKAKKIMSKTAYASILDIKADIDLAVIAIPSKFVPGVMEECGKKGVKAAIIISAGFSEIGDVELEDEVLKIAEKYKIRVLGPNCLGLILPYHNLNASFFGKTPDKGGIAFVSQSGALGVAVLDWAIKTHIGLSAFVSIGNASDVDFASLLEYFEKDKHTKAICLYIESLKDGREFIEASSKVKKPIIVLKSGSSEAGAKAATSHTAALATADKIYDGVFKQYKIMRVENLYQMFEVAQHFVHGTVPFGRKGLIITNAGGPGVLASDAFEKNDLEVVKLPAEVLKKLNGILPEHWSHNNPVDIIGDAKPERYKKTLKIIEEGGFFDFLFLILTPQTMSEADEVAKLLVDFRQRKSIPCFGCFMGGGQVSAAKKILKKKGILNFSEPEYGADVIGRMIK